MHKLLIMNVFLLNYVYNLGYCSESFNGPFRVYILIRVY